MSARSLLIQSFLRDPVIRKGKIDLLWPCWLYSVSLLVARDNLNILEKAILRMFAIGIVDPLEITDRLCLCDVQKTGGKIDDSLARMTIARLTNRNFVKGSILTKEGKEAINESVQCSYETAIMYHELLGGSLLPYISLKSPTYLLPDQEGGFYLGVVGDKNRLRHPVTLKPTTRPMSRPDASQVVAAIRDYVQICCNDLCFNNDEHEDINFVNNPDVIQLQGNPRRVYLHCVCTLTKDGRDILVQNPFGFENFLPQLSSAITSSPHAAEIKKRLLRAKETARPTVAHKPPEFEPYPEIARSLEDMERAKGRCDVFIRAAYSALEHILNRLLKDAEKRGLNIRTAAALLTNSSISENLERLEQAARTMEQTLDEETAWFLSVPSEEINRILKGHATLRPLLALNLFLATLGQHPLENFLRKSPDTIKTLAMIHTLRNQYAHGDEEGLVANTENAGQACNLVMGLLKAWKPEIGYVCFSPERTAAVSRVDAEQSLLRFFQPATRQKLPPLLDEQLIRAEEQMLAYGIDELAESDEMVSQACVVDLANLCQMFFAPQKATTENGNMLDQALENAKNAGFDLFEGRFPGSLATTAIHQAENAAKGAATTLGGQCLAWLCLEASEKLAQMAALAPGLIMHTGDLIQLRGHANGEVPARHVALNRNSIYEDLNLLWEGTNHE